MKVRRLLPLLVVGLVGIATAGIASAQEDGPPTTATTVIVESNGVPVDANQPAQVPDSSPPVDTAPLPAGDSISPAPPQVLSLDDTRHGSETLFRLWLVATVAIAVFFAYQLRTTTRGDSPQSL